MSARVFRKPSLDKMQPYSDNHKKEEPFEPSWEKHLT
jgi:hypothetical protein